MGQVGSYFQEPKLIGQLVVSHVNGSPRFVGKCSLTQGNPRRQVTLFTRDKFSPDKRGLR